MNMEQAFEMALKNIAKHGDTDIFPFPFETHVFHDALNKCKQFLVELHNNFDDFLSSYPPTTIVTLTQIGYTGFRWATQIDPFWNAYYLSLIISLAEQIESRRVPECEMSVFSYRYGWDEANAKLFKDITWKDFRTHSIKLSQSSEFVITTDIADFYSRINHHRVENALNRLPNAGDLPSRIMKLLTVFSKNVSYGLPIGGPASRIIAELALVLVDENLTRRRIKFTRYADDYCIFCDTKSNAYELLVLLSEKLFNEGLILQKNKTRIVTSKEFRESSGLLDPKTTTSGNGNVSEEQKLLNISIRFDPYSPTAEEDYEQLKSAVNEVDIIGILGREVAKTTIDVTVSKQAINAIKALEPITREGAVKTILKPENLEVLAPVFVTIMRTIKGVYEELDAEGKNFVDNSLINIFEKYSHLLSVELNLSYFIYALSVKNTQRKEEILVEIYDQKSSSLIRRQIILIMANWKCFYWLSDIKQKYSGLSEWEKRAFIISSYILGDEGRHWRDNTKRTWTPMDSLVRDWFADRFQKNRTIPL
ncbi:MAG: RNA-directed DNA polymerase [Desulfobacterales bacterium]|nr:RNA-directed DNA polymerase [Desulfobacterales bacterium]